MREIGRRGGGCAGPDRGHERQNQESVAEFKIALALQPDYPVARFNLADSEIQAGDLDDAIQNLRQVVAENPADPMPRSRLEHALAARRALGSARR